MFDKDRFTQDCIAAVADGQQAIRELVEKAVSDSASVMSAFGEPQRAGVTTLYRSPELTVINFVWAPCMTLMPHNHQMFAVIGIYSGREDNVFWKRSGPTITAASARSLGVGDVAALGRDTIHSVLNPIEKLTCAIHVYGGDFFAPTDPRSSWDHETLVERPYDFEQVRKVFRDAEARFNAVKTTA